MIVFLTLLYIGVLFLLVRFKVVPPRRRSGGRWISGSFPPPTDPHQVSLSVPAAARGGPRAAGIFGLALMSSLRGKRVIRLCFLPKSSRYAGSFFRLVISR